MATGFSAVDAHKYNIAEVVVDIANIIGRSPAQVALNWLRQQPGVVIPIIGARKVSQVEDNIASVDFKLEDDHLQRLDEVSKIEMGFPHDFFKMEMVRQFVYGGMRDEIDNHRAE
jgi:aryl-alcohol dehydrogenase-like predicted oxidoreductase